MSEWRGQMESWKSFHLNNQSLAEFNRELHLTNGAIHADISQIDCDGYRLSEFEWMSQFCSLLFLL